MTDRGDDLPFPECCAHCPHLQSVSASCSHESRQALLAEVRTNPTCSVFSEAKADAMRRLSESL
jgi:hypothetical protein